MSLKSQRKQGNFNPRTTPHQASQRSLNYVYISRGCCVRDSSVKEVFYVFLTSTRVVLRIIQLSGITAFLGRA